MARADPKFVQSVPVAYNFERQQHLRVSVYDADEKASNVASLDLHGQDHLGAVEMDLAEVVRGAGGAGVKCALVGAKAQGYLTVRAEERLNFKRLLTVDIKGYRLAKRDGCAAAHTCVLAGMRHRMALDRFSVALLTCALNSLIHLRAIAPGRSVQSQCTRTMRTASSHFAAADPCEHLQDVWG